MQNVDRNSRCGSDGEKRRGKVRWVGMGGGGGVPLIIPGPSVCSNVYYETGSINIVETALLAA